MLKCHLIWQEIGGDKDLHDQMPIIYQVINNLIVKCVHSTLPTFSKSEWTSEMINCLSDLVITMVKKMTIFGMSSISAGPDGWP